MLTLSLKSSIIFIMTFFYFTCRFWRLLHGNRFVHVSWFPLTFCFMYFLNLTVKNRQMLKIFVKTFQWILFSFRAFALNSNYLMLIFYFFYFYYPSLGIFPFIFKMFCSWFQAHLCTQSIAGFLPFNRRTVSFFR